MADQSKTTRNKVQIAWLAILFFAVALASRPLFELLPSPISTIAWKSFWVVVCFIGIVITYRINFKGICRELTLNTSIGRGIAISVLASLPMLVIFAVNLDLNRGISVLSIFLTSILAPFTEELLFRGYFFLQLYRRAGWSFMVSVIVSAAIFGIAHYTTLAGRANVADILAEIGIIALGGVFYAWLLVRWDSLWVPIFLHAFMNLWCEGFACDQIVSQSSTNVGRLLTVVLAIVVTVLGSRESSVKE